MSSPLDGNGVAAPELKDGQIYRSRWADAVRHEAGLRSWRTYHCRSQLAVVKGGRLFDTYWSDFSHEIATALVELTLVGDEKWPKVSEGEALRYDRKDLCDTRHANSSHAPIYVRPGAQLNKAAMLAVLDDREADARSAIRMAEWRLEEIAKKRALLDGDNLDEVML